MDQAAVKALAYVVLESPVLDAWERFGSEVLGMQPVRVEDQLILRMDDRAQRLVVRSAPTDRLVAVGWDVATRADLDVARRVLGDANVRVSDGSASEVRARAVEELVWTLDPDGNRVELVFGARRDLVFDGGTRPVSSFVTGDMGMGHVVLMAKDLAAMRGFYEGLLGFRLTDHIHDQLVFLRCNRRHHSLGLFGFGTSGLNHLMIEVADIDDVGRGLDALRQSGSEPAADLGRHANDEMFSFYAWSPGGFMIEYGTGGKRVGPDAKPCEAAPDIWGHSGLRQAHANLSERTPHT